MTTTLTKETNSAGITEHGATVVITHRIRAGQQAQYDAWLSDIAAISKHAEGLLDWQVVKPIDGFTTTYTIILRFVTQERLHHWMGSAARATLIEQVRPLLADDDQFVVRSGLDFLFMQDGAPTKAPVRWKQFLLTWSAIYPLSLGISLSVLPLLHDLGLPQNRFLNAFCVSGLMVGLMVYVVMPRYTKLVHRWLFAQ